MQLERRIKISLAKRGLAVFKRSDVAPLGSASQISVALSSLISKGVISRSSKGVYSVVKVLRPAVQRTQSVLVDSFKVRDLRPEDVDAFVMELAQSSGVRFRRTGVHDVGDAITRLAGDEVRLDSIGEALLGLVARSVITKREMGHLYAGHLKARRDVRSVR